MGDVNIVDEQIQLRELCGGRFRVRVIQHIIVQIEGGAREKSIFDGGRRPVQAVRREDIKIGRVQEIQIACLVKLQFRDVIFQGVGVDAMDVFPIYPVRLVIDVDDISVRYRRVILVDGNVGGGVEVEILIIGIGQKEVGGRGRLEGVCRHRFLRKGKRRARNRARCQGKDTNHCRLKLLHTELL